MEKDKDIQKNRMKGNHCHLCKRTEVEVQEFLISHLSEITEAYNSEIANRELELKNKKSKLMTYLDDMLKATEKSSLDFKIRTVEDDLNSFRKIIPTIEELVEISKDFPDCNTLLDVRAVILELRKDIEDDQIYAKEHNKKMKKSKEVIELLESIEKLSKKRDKHLTSLEHKKRFIRELKLHNFTTILSKEHRVRYADDDKSLEKDMTEHPENYEVPISFSICVICNTLVKDDRSRRNLSLNDYILDKETESRYSGFI